LSGPGDAVDEQAAADQQGEKRGDEQESGQDRAGTSRHAIQLP
jgi:hypothetical protein